MQRKWRQPLLLGLIVMAGSVLGEHLESEPEAAEKEVPVDPSETEESIEAFTSNSYAAYLDAVEAFEEGELDCAPEPAAFLRRFTLVREATEPPRTEGHADGWRGNIAVYAAEDDPEPSGWIIRTTLSGDLEGLPVLSDTQKPLPAAPRDGETEGDDAPAPPPPQE